MSPNFPFLHFDILLEAEHSEPWLDILRGSNAEIADRELPFASDCE